MDCRDLIGTTAAALNEDVVSLMLVAVQRGNLDLSVRRALNRWVCHLSGWVSNDLNKHCRVHSSAGIEVKSKDDIVQECLRQFPYIWASVINLSIWCTTHNAWYCPTLRWWAPALTHTFHWLSWPLCFAIQFVSGCHASLCLSLLTTLVPGSPESKWLLQPGVFQVCSWHLFLAFSGSECSYSLLYFKPADDSSLWLSREWVMAVIHCVSILCKASL